MSASKRMHPFKIVQAGIRTIANNLVFIILLFVLRAGDTSTLIIYARIAFLALLGVQFISILIQWWKTTYTFTNDSVHQYRGVFKNKHHSMHLGQLENIQQHTPFHFKIFGVTSLILNTRSTDSSASITFEALSNNEATQIKKHIEAFRSEDVQTEEHHEVEKRAQINEEISSPHKDQAVHFRADKKSLIKASLLSLNILIIVPVLLAIYENMKDIFPLEKYIDGALGFIMTSWITILLTVIILIMSSIIIGFVSTFLTYGNYQITSDKERIYMQSGVLNEKHMSIRKANVQAIRIHQTPLKKVLHMSEIMLVSTATDEEDFGVQSLYPFLSTKRANQLIQELLPHFHTIEKTKKLPKYALLMKMIRIPWAFLLAALFVWIFKSSWTFILPVIFVGTYFSRYFDYRNSRYAFSDASIQFYSGGLSSISFHTNRRQVIEVEIAQSFIQQKLGLATIKTINKSTPVHEESMIDIHAEDAEQFSDWYSGRMNEVVVQR